MPQIEIFIGTDMQHYWRMRARNGRIVAIGGEGYASARNARRAAARLVRSLQINA